MPANVDQRQYTFRSPFLPCSHLSNQIGHDDGTLSTLVVFIQTLNLVKGPCSISSAQVAFGCASALFTIILVCFPHSSKTNFDLRLSRMRWSKIKITWSLDGLAYRSCRLKAGRCQGPSCTCGRRAGRRTHVEDVKSSVRPYPDPRPLDRWYSRRHTTVLSVTLAVRQIQGQDLHPHHQQVHHRSPHH